MCGRFDDACRELFENYVPIMTELGEGEEHAFAFALRLMDCVSPENREDCVLMDAVRRAAGGGRLDFGEVHMIGKKLKEGWQSFALRRRICGILMDQAGAYAALSTVDAVPIGELLAISPN
jgi:hypothetical protein